MNTGTRSLRNFCVAVYDAEGNVLQHYLAPNSLIVPFVNRLFDEVLDEHSVTEPFFRLYTKADTEFLRSPRPAGLTSLYGRPFDPAAQGLPEVRLLPDARVRHVEIVLGDLQQELFKGAYTVDDLFLSLAYHLVRNDLLKRRPSVNANLFYYALIPSPTLTVTVSKAALPDDAYDVEGVFRLPPVQRRESRVQFRPVPEPPFPEVPAGFPIVPTTRRGKGDLGKGRVIIPRSLYDQMHVGLTLSTRKEQGGYVFGNVYRQPGSPEDETSDDFRWVLDVTDLLMAENTVGSAVKLLFTGDSWSKVSRRRDSEFAGKQMAGWFHTHLFPATEDFGLSQLDQDMHGWYLPKPWQVAILLNLENDGRRTVRCYQRGPMGDLVETEFEIAETAGERQNTG
ncbi:hypothetical protein M2352_003366 [Azospirillum fermentarium]|uniref:hypothetical protein n=1 Tax=Azospirillum fermentarium TaxID=1233114 RepID=UPI002226E380|nr:hypothetical protein [Azospirillum fermentarium]MCW2247732.1 hypothetical protein [Azospirillum fermentarium]